jgi:hypothetical protein
MRTLIKQRKVPKVDGKKDQSLQWPDLNFLSTGAKKILNSFCICDASVKLARMFVTVSGLSRLHIETSVWLISDALFQLSVIYISYSQVLTPVNNLKLLLKLPVLDKLRLVTFHLQATQRNYNNWFRRNESSHDLDS